MELHRSFVGMKRTRDDVHERALARAVLADERMHLALAQLEIDAVQCHRWAKRFGDL